jgi:hypothetical protein
VIQCNPQYVCPVMEPFKRCTADENCSQLLQTNGYLRAIGRCVEVGICERAHVSACRIDHKCVRHNMIYQDQWAWPASAPHPSALCRALPHTQYHQVCERRRDEWSGRRMAPGEPSYAGGSVEWDHGAVDSGFDEVRRRSVDVHVCDRDRVSAGTLWHGPPWALARRQAMHGGRLHGTATLPSPSCIAAPCDLHMIFRLLVCRAILLLMTVRKRTLEMVRDISRGKDCVGAVAYRAGQGYNQVHSVP